MRDQKREVKTSFGSVDRPAWLSNDLHAFNHKFSTFRGMRVKQEDYYKKSKGIRQKQSTTAPPKLWARLCVALNLYHLFGEQRKWKRTKQSECTCTKQIELFKVVVHWMKFKSIARTLKHQAVPALPNKAKRERGEKYLVYMGIFALPSHIKKLFGGFIKTPQYTHIHNLEGHTGTVLCLTLHENKLYTGSDDKTIRIWKVGDLEKRKRRTPPGLHR